MLQDAVDSAACEGLLRKGKPPQITRVKLDGQGSASRVGAGFLDQPGAGIQPDDKAIRPDQFSHPEHIVSQATTCIQDTLARAELKQLVCPSLIVLEVGKRIEKRQAGRIGVGILCAIDIDKAGGKILVAHLTLRGNIQPLVSLGRPR